MANLVLDLDNSYLTKAGEIENAGALLALMHGKSDSICRFYNKEILVGIKEICVLNEKITSKLMTNNVSAITTVVDIVLSNKTIYSFKTLEEYKKFNWNYINESTKSIFVQWDFFLKLEGFEIPQRHTISVRLSSQPNTSEILKAMVSGSVDDTENIETNMAMLICKVDFISNILAEELIHVVEEWHARCELAISKKGKLRKFIYNQKSAVTQVFVSLFGIFLSLLLCIACKYFFEKLHVDISSYYPSIVVYLLIFFLPLNGAFRFITNIFGNYIFEKLGNIMDVHVFSITGGDLKQIEKVEKTSKSTKEVIIFVLGVIIDIILAYIFYIL